MATSWSRSRRREPKGRKAASSRVGASPRAGFSARDRGCRFPGCGLRFTDAHHVKHWADGGETILSNLVLLCRRHHRAVHEGGVQVCVDRDGQVVFFSPRGEALLGAPPAPKRRGWDEEGPEGEKAERPTPYAGAAAYTRDHHIPWALAAAAWEALEAADSG